MEGIGDDKHGDDGGAKGVQLHKGDKVVHHGVGVCYVLHEGGCVQLQKYDEGFLPGLDVEVCHGVAGRGGVQLHNDDDEIQHEVNVCLGQAGGRGVQLYYDDEEVHMGWGCAMV